MKLKITRRALMMHIFFFSLFLVIPTLVFERLPGESIFTVTRVILQDTIANFILLCFFYLNYYVLIPKYYFERKYLLYILIIIAFLAIAFQLPHLIGKWASGNVPDMPPAPPPIGDGRPPGLGQSPPPGSGPGSPHLFPFSVHEFRRHLFLFFTAFFFSFLLRTRERLSQAREDKLNAELSSLKAQINPHFLFNTLNSIYALSVKHDDKASEAIVHLSGLMRYVTKDVNDHAIPLYKEIEYITNYIELQKARLGNTVKVRFNIFGEVDDRRITPLILITYIENAFKYGVNPDVEGCIVRIKLHVTDTGVLLQTFNKKVPNLNRAESTGIGMKNTGERLMHLYPGKHSLKVIDNEQDYSVILSLDLI